MAKLSDISNRAIRELFSCRMVPSAGTMVLAKGNGSAAKIDSTNGCDLVIAGRSYALAALNEVVVTALAALQNPVTGQDTFYVQPVSQTVYYTIVANSGGTVYCIQGTYSGQTFTPFKNKLGDGSIPDVAVADTYCVLGYVKVVTDATHTFTPATTAFDAAGITSTFYDAVALP